MKRQEVTFTALPNGLGGGNHRLSVLVSPRLQTDIPPRTLAKWGDFVDWPQTVAGIEWEIHFGSTAATATGSPAGPEPSSDLWTELFPKDTFVRSNDFAKHLKGFDALPVMSFPSKHVHDFLKEKYLQFAESSELPAVQDLLDAYELIGYLDEREKLRDLDDLIEQIEAELATSKAIPHGPPNPAKDFAQLLLFHRPASKPTPNDPDNKYRRIDPKAPILDFHQALALLGEHPQIERVLGIVVDLTFTPPAGVNGDTEVWLEPQWDSAIGNQSKVVGPLKTRCHLTPTSFQALPRSTSPELSPEGLLRLNDQFPSDGARKFELIEVDHDGAAIKTVNFVNELKRGQLAKHKTTDTPAESAIPNFRSGGLSIVRTERAVQTHLKFAGIAGLDKLLFHPQSQQEDEEGASLSREDLTRGYAYDAYDVRTGGWYALCRRVGEFSVDGSSAFENVPLDEDTGWVSLAVPQSADGHDDRLRIHEAAASWGNNWSMVAPRPGNTVSPDEVPVTHEPNPKDFKLGVSYTVAPGSLPPQRFGRSYYLRARAVDLAGNEAPVAQADATGFQHALGPETYGRFDPVAPPTVLMRKPISEAESTERMVIRSNYSTAPGETVPNERHVFPPSIDQVRAEIIGALDNPSLDPNAYDMLVARQGGFGDADEQGDPLYPDQQFDGGNYGAPYYDAYVPEFPAENDGTARMPSLPDPFAQGAAFLGLPGSASGLDTYMFFPDTNWPDTLPFLIQIFESASFVPPQLASIEGARVVRVGLPKADVFRVRMSAYPSAEDLDRMGVWKWLQEAGLASGDLEDEALAGQHWAITPGRTLTLTHAVRQPLVPTAFDVPSLAKGIGKTFVVLSDRLSTSRKSTERLDMGAEWTEVSDFLDPETGEWEPERETQVQALAFQKRIDLAGPENLLPIAERHELHHTRHIPEVTYSPVATTRFKEHFVDRKQLAFPKPPASQTLPLDSQWTGPAAGDEGVVPDSETVQSLDGSETYQRGRHYDVDYDAGTITRRTVKVSPQKPPKPQMPAKVKASYLVPPITREDTPPASLRVLSSARPDAPKALYAVPNFKWERSGTDLPIVSERGGGSLRVYMDRPWWSSGAEELLGVVVWGEGNPPEEPDKRMKPFVTQRAQDPAWLSSPQPSVLPGRDDFTNRVVFENGEDLELTLEEVPGVNVRVAGHPVFPDPARRLWFSDIDISPEASYFPFVRLALARFQPHSVRQGDAGVALSRVILLDYIQLAPDRVATIRSSSDTELTVSVFGLSYTQGGAGIGPGTMEVTVEQRRPQMPTGDDSLAWVAAPGDPVVLEPRDGGDGQTQWLGTVTLPGPRGSQPFRLSIREYEKHIASEGGAIGRRLVYLDTIEI